MSFWHTKSHLMLSLTVYKPRSPPETSLSFFWMKTTQKHHVRCRGCRHSIFPVKNLQDLQSFWFQAKTQPSTLASEASSQNTRTVLTFSTHSSLLVQRVLSQTTVVVAPLKSSQALQNKGKQLRLPQTVKHCSNYVLQALTT